MSDEPIVISNDSTLSGIGNIKLSRVGNRIFIGNTNSVDPGVPGSLAVYSNTDGELKSSGEKLTWDSEPEILAVPNLSAVEIDITGTLHFSDSDNNRTLTLSVDDTGITSLMTRTVGRMATSLSIDQAQRVIVQKKLNLGYRKQVFSSIGTEGDRFGDLAVTNEYIYYCTKNFNGESDIWVRWKVTDTKW